MNLETYLNRIGYRLPVHPNRKTLDGLVAAQLQTVAFENLDQQLGVPVSNTLPKIYDKIVMRNRGGWCFELNGLFAWALQAIGFEVSMLAGFVGADRPEPDRVPNHMLLRVECDGPLLVDVGFGGGPNAPVPLRPGTVTQPPFEIALTDEGNGFLRYTDRAREDVSSYWFKAQAVSADAFDPANRQLQTDPTSPFLRVLTAQRRHTDRHVALRGLLKTTTDAERTVHETLPDAQALVDCLRQDFGLDVPQIAACWPALWQRHEHLSRDGG